MLLPLLSVFAMAVANPQVTLDPAVLIDIFGTPAPTRSPDAPPRLEDITVKPTESGQTFTNSKGEQCQCVPYYLCDEHLIALNKNNVSVTGWGVLDVRFGTNDGCQESLERCCKNPLPEPEPVTPDPTQLKGCGYRNSKGLDFQVTGGNGNEAQFGEFPWVVALLAPNGSYIGVGVLIHPQVLLTGAHIAYKVEKEDLEDGDNHYYDDADDGEDSSQFEEVSPDNGEDKIFISFSPGSIVARAGEWDTQTNKERLKSQERLVSDIVVRNDFNPNNLKNDLAVLRLQEPFELDQHINVICLPNQHDDFDRYRGCVANGWGKDVFGRQGRYAVILKKIEIDMVPFDKCGNFLRKTRLGPRFRLHESFVCAGGEEGKDTCQGDGGAPLACPIGDDRYKLTGLVAWGIGCGQQDVPAVYARVALFRNWIDDVMISWGYSSEGYTVY